MTQCCFPAWKHVTMVTGATHMSNPHNYDLNVEEKVVKTYIVYELSYYTPLIV